MASESCDLFADVRAGGPGLKHSYSYDAADRLRLAEMRDAFFLLRSSPYPLDGVGNRVPEQVGLAPWGMSSAMPDPADYQMNQYTSTDFDVRSYDENGNTRVTLLTLAWVWLPSRVIACDYRNQIVSVLDPFTAATSSHTLSWTLSTTVRRSLTTAGRLGSERPQADRQCESCDSQAFSVSHRSTFNSETISNFSKFECTTNSAQPSINQLQPIPDNSNPNSITIGNPNLVPTFSHKFDMSFNSYKPVSGKYIWTNANFIITDNAPYRTGLWFPCPARRPSRARPQ